MFSFLRNRMYVLRDIINIPFPVSKDLQIEYVAHSVTFKVSKMQ